VIVAALWILALILLRSPAALLMLAVLTPSWVWLAIGVTIAVLAIAAINERRHGRPF
jgi:hypothetical protein